MTLIFKQIVGFIRLLNSETGTDSLAAGLVVGMFLGFSPGFSLQALVAYLLIFFFRVQGGAAVVSAVVFKLIAWVLDPLFHWVGTQVLEIGALRPLYTALYNMPLVPLTRFNNTIVMGGLVVSILLAPGAFFAFRSLVVKYRTLIWSRIKESRAMKVLEATRFYSWYTKYERLRG